MLQQLLGSQSLAPPAIWWVPIKNIDDDPIPGYGAVEVVEVNEDGYLTVQRPSASSLTTVLFNGPQSVQPGGYGSAHCTFPAIAAYEADADTEDPAGGETWGTEGGSWYLQKGQAGFRILGGATEGIVNVIPAPVAVREVAGGLEAEPLPSPDPPFVDPQGTTGATTYSYVVSAVTPTGETLPSQATTTATGNATLSSTNYNAIAWQPVPGATAYNIYRDAGGTTQGLIGTVEDGEPLTLSDTGLAATTKPPTQNTSGETKLDGGLVALGGALFTSPGTPDPPAATAEGTTGGTTITYAVSALTATGETLASAAVTVANANATLSSTDYVQLTWDAVPGAGGYNIYRPTAGGTPSSTGLIATVGAGTLSLRDTGLVGDGGGAPEADTAGNVAVATFGGGFNVASLDTPDAPAVANVGTAGASTSTYKVVANSGSGATPASLAATTTTGNASPDATNHNLVTWDPVPGAVDYDIYRTAGGGSTGLIGTVPAGEPLKLADAGLVGDGASAPTENTSALIRRNGVAALPQIKVAAAQFDKTNTTLADVPGLAVALDSGKTYAFRAFLDTLVDAAGGLKVAMGGTATASAFIAWATIVSGTPALDGANRAASLGATIASASGQTKYGVFVEGTLTTSGAGTLTLQFAQAAATGTSSVKVGSSLTVTYAPLTPPLSLAPAAPPGLHCRKTPPRRTPSAATPPRRTPSAAPPPRPTPGPRPCASPTPTRTSAPATWYYSAAAASSRASSSGGRAASTATPACSTA
jgi:hypothetical protein